MHSEGHGTPNAKTREELPLAEKTKRREHALNVDESSLRDTAEQHGQGHLFTFWDRLDSSGRDRLRAEIATIDFPLISRLVDEHVRRESAGSDDAGEARLTPAPVLSLAEREEGGRPSSREIEARACGDEVLRRGEVAAFVVAGGQGTRLGWDGPKGTFPVGPVTSRTLFQYFAEQILALGRRYGAPIPWYVMTSEANDAETRRFFEEHDRFGIAQKNSSIFTQDMMPAVGRDGKILLDSPSSIVRSPNGHGGSIKALYDSGAIDEMQERGVRWISYFQVDNPLVPVCDPAFIGYHVLAGAEMSAKVVRKASWDEKVGVIGRRDERLSVIEYSDLPEERARETESDGSLRWWAGSIAIHIFSVDFVARLNDHGFRLPFHVARKKIPHIDLAGNAVSPDEEEGLKFETFVFDALGEARGAVTLEVRREDEFSPVKNREGGDSVDTCRRDLTARNLRWLEAAGARIARGSDGDFEGHVEIGPLSALDAAGVARRIAPGAIVEPGFVL